MKILLVKLSSLGDVVHTLPVVQDIHAAMPGAQIDWVVEKSFAPLLLPLLLPPPTGGSGLHRVITCELRRWRKAPFSAATRQAWRSFKTQLQTDAYDAIIDLQGLTKSALVARLARLKPLGKRYALANRTEGSGYEAPTRWVADVAIRMAPHIHAVQRSRELAAKALRYSFQENPDFGLKVALKQARQAQEAPEIIATSNAIAFVHGTSRADKTWPTAHWIELGQRLNAAGYQIVLPHGNAQERLTSQAIAQALNQGEVVRQVPRAVVWPLLSLDLLTAELARCVGVIGVDSGVSHIAVALNLPHVQIYNFDTAWRTGPVASGQSEPTKQVKQVSVFAQPAPSVNAVWQAWLGCCDAAVLL